MIWITGASTGIGASCANEAAKLGAKLVLSARNETLLKEIKQKCLGKYHMDDQVCIKFGLPSFYLYNIRQHHEFPTQNIVIHFTYEKRTDNTKYKLDRPGGMYLRTSTL